MNKRTMFYFSHMITLSLIKIYFCCNRHDNYSVFPGSRYGEAKGDYILVSIKSGVESVCGQIHVEDVLSAQIDFGYITKV